MAGDITADVVIVGSGISGALIGARLAAAGVKVAILEAGPRVDRSTAVENFWNAVIKVPECPVIPPDAQAMHPISSDMDFWYKQVGADKFASTYLRQVGGTTWHWLGTCLRLRAATTSRSRRAWPRRRLAALVRRARAVLRGGGARDRRLRRFSRDLARHARSPIRCPAIPQTYLDKAYVRALGGTKYQVRSTPQGRNSVDRGNRPACCGNAELHPGLSGAGEIRCHRASGAIREERRRAPR